MLHRREGREVNGRPRREWSVKAASDLKRFLRDWPHIASFHWSFSDPSTRQSGILQRKEKWQGLKSTKEQGFESLDHIWCSTPIIFKAAHSCLTWWGEAIKPSIPPARKFSKFFRQAPGSSTLLLVPPPNVNFTLPSSNQQHRHLRDSR